MPGSKPALKPGKLYLDGAVSQKAAYSGILEQGLTITLLVPAELDKLL
jgi:hypothetical protein